MMTAPLSGSVPITTKVGLGGWSGTIVCGTPTSGRPSSRCSAFANSTSSALTVGGGMDYDLPFFHHAFAFRLFQADYRYIHESYGPPAAIPTGGSRT